jgi:cytoskeleton protein RodZ
MAAARETDETVSSGSETKSGNNNVSGANSRNASEITHNSAKPNDDSEPSAVTESANADAAAPSPPPSEPSKAGGDNEPSLGKTLTAARERRGLSRADLIAETHIPAHYVEMIESSDYGLISDQLYLMPFLRRYAAFLRLDGEEVAMRFVREVQRAEVAAAPRMSEPLAVHDRRRAPWGRIALVIIVLSAIVVLYIIVSEHHRGEFGFRQSPPAAPAAAIPPAAAAPPPMTAPPSTTVTTPQAAAPARIPESNVVGIPAAPRAAQSPQKVSPPARSTSPADSGDE